MGGGKTVSKQTKRAGRGLGALLVAGLSILIFSTCDLEVFNPGAITDEALNDPSLMKVVAAGVANEFNSLPDNLALDILRLTDQAAGNGSYNGTGRLRRGTLEWDETNGDWAQIHETIWTGLAAWYRMTDLEEYDQTRSKDAARIWLLIGMAHRMFGENYCQVVYSIGSDFAVPEKGTVKPRTAAFDSAIVSLTKAISLGQAAGGSDDVIMAARAGIAQAYVGLNDFASATQWSTQVPTDFVYSALYNMNSNSNVVWQETIGRNEVGLFNTYSYNLANGPDPRVPYDICGTFDVPTDPFNSTVSRTDLCNSENGADGVTAHVRQTKYPDEGSDIPIAKGTEMRLIEAEAAMLANNLTDFTARINDVRSHFGLAAIAAPATVGALEYNNSPTSPFERVLHNAYDASTGNVGDPGVDAWSILDGERHLTMFGEARRLWDLHRWDHPFLNGGVVFWDTEVRRASCFPLPDDECTLNQEIVGSTLLTGVGNATHTCG